MRRRSWRHEDWWITRAWASPIELFLIASAMSAIDRKQWVAGIVCGGCLVVYTVGVAVYEGFAEAKDEGE